MASIFTDIVSGLVWLGKHIEEGFVDVEKVIKIVPVVDAEAPVLASSGVTIIQDAGALALAAVKDGGVLITDIEALIADAEAGNIAGAVTAAETIFSDATKVATFSDVIAAVKKLVADSETFGAAAETAAKAIDAAAQ